MVEQAPVAEFVIPYEKKCHYNFTPQVVKMIRAGFKAANKDGKIDLPEFTKMMKGYGHETTKETIDEKFANHAADGSIDWNQYIDTYGECEGKFAADWQAKTPVEYEDGTISKKTFKQDNGIYGYSQFKEEEVHAFSNSINNNLEGDETVAERIPICSEHHLFYGMSDGLILIRLAQKLDADSIFEGAVNKNDKNGQMDIFKVEANINLALNALKGKIKMTGINAAGFLELRPTTILSVLTQTCKLLAIKDIDLKHCNEIWRLKEGDEEVADVLKLKPE